MSFFSRPQTLFVAGGYPTVEQSQYSVTNPTKVQSTWFGLCHDQKALKKCVCLPCVLSRPEPEWKYSEVQKLFTSHTGYLSGCDSAPNKRRSRKEGRVSFGSQFEGAVPHGGKGMVAGV